MKDGKHAYNQINPKEAHEHKNLITFGLIAIAIAIMAYDIGNTAKETADINNVFEIVVNNTNLAPNIHSVFGTGERVSGVTYYANNSPIQLMVYAHAMNVSQTAFVGLSINGTIVLPQSGRPLGSAEQSNRSISAIIPKFASYKVDIENAHHYEWREYQILSGKNGTISLNATYVNYSSTLPNNYSTITAGSYTGDGTPNRAIQHYLNKTPKIVHVSLRTTSYSITIINGYVHIVTCCQVVDYQPTIWDASNFYIGINPGGGWGNDNGVIWDWVAEG